mmetsp:Transcript_55936/g.155978  ORF Transcript_55936/g.155978 Transcript_55936/m.155978 type:complete len:362 (+) Transcript_55936:107-1192(+)
MVGAIRLVPASAFISSPTAPEQWQKGSLVAEGNGQPIPRDMSACARSGIAMPGSAGRSSTVWASAFPVVVMGAAAWPSRARRNFRVRRGAEPEGGGFVTQLRRRVGGRRLVLEEELTRAKSFTAAAEKHAEELRRHFEAELAEEKDVAAQLRDELLKVRRSYDSLNDELEMSQMQSSEEISRKSKSLEEAFAALEEAKQKEAALMKRLLAGEEHEKKLEADGKKLVEELNAANETKLALESQLSCKDKIVHDTLSELEAEQAARKKLGAEMEQAEMRETEYKRRIQYVEEENELLKQRLEAAQALESRLAEMSAKLAESHKQNIKLDEELKATGAKLAVVLEEKKPGFRSRSKGKDSSKGK